MAENVTTGAIHHVGLTVADLDRSVEFYTSMLDFKLIGEFGSKRLLHNGALMIGVGPAQAGDTRFDEGRVGLDHLSFGVASRADLERAAAALDQRGVLRGEITDLAPFGISILAFRDPDNIALELTAPYQA